MTAYHLFVLHQEHGRGLGDLGGVQVYLPPKRAHRMRRRDVLFIYLHQEGNAPLGAREQRRLLDKLAERYFGLAGSATAALKELAIALNAYFLGRNRKMVSQGKQMVGWLALGVWRHEMLYMALSGPVHAVVMGETTTHYHDPQVSGRGLGISRAPRLYFISSRFGEGDALLVAPHLPAAWDERVLRLNRQRQVSPLLRRLMSYSGGEVEAALVHLRGGEAEVRRVVIGAAAAETPSVEPPQSISPEAAPQGAPSPSPEAPSPSPKPQQPAPQQAAVPSPPRPASSRPRAQAHPAGAQPPAMPDIPSRRATEKADKAKPIPKKETPPRQRRTTRRWPGARQPLRSATETFRKGLAALWRAGEGIWNGFRSLASQGFSPVAEEALALPKSFMALSAVAVPLVVVTIALVVFMRRGRAQQYAAYFARAQAEAQQAEGIEEPVARRNAFAEALSDLDAAEAYMQTDDSRVLRQRLQTALDGLDGVERLEFRPVADRLPVGVQVKRLLFQGADLYALDTRGQQVYHFYLEGEHYARDKDFVCTAGTYGELQIEAVVDIALLTHQVQPHTYNIVGIDASGHGVLCGPGKEPAAFTLPPAAPINWHSPAAVDYFEGALYILDPAATTVEVVNMDGTGDFNGTPYTYFTEGAPEGIAEMVDLAVTREGVYLLRADGQISRCQETQDRVACETLVYHDTRPGRGDVPVIPETRFMQVQLTGAPDPSLYLLDGVQGAVYRFSYRLQFVAQYLPQQPLAGEITAFAVDPETHLMFVAAGRQIYAAVMR